MSTLDWTIEIPSYRRAGVIQNGTLSLLERCGIEDKRITVWVADAAERRDYAARLGKRYKLQVGALGLVAARNAFHRARPKGAPLLAMDDDLQELLALPINGTKLQPFRRLADLAEWSFREAAKKGLARWGVVATANHFYMDRTVTTGLRFCVGAMFGSRGGDPVFTDSKAWWPKYGSCEDFVATLRAYERDGAVLRHDWLALQTRYFAPGGINAHVGGPAPRLRVHEQELLQTADKWPELATVKRTKEGRCRSLRLKTLTKSKEPWPAFAHEPAAKARKN